MKNKTTALKAGIGYIVGNFLVKGINFLVIPLFSRLMTTKEFGVYNVFLSYDAILSVIVGLALHSSVRSAHYEYEGETDKYVSSITLIYIINSLLLFFFFMVFSKKLVLLTGFDLSVMLLLIPFSFGGAILQLYNERLSLDYSYKRYLVVALVNSFGNIMLSLILICTIFSNKKDIGRIIGTTGSIFVLSVAVIYSMYKKAIPIFSKKYWRFGLRYSLPIVPHGISQVLLSQFDRIMINNMVSSAAAGIYSLSGNLKLVLTVLTNSISISWSTWFYSKISENKKNEIQESANYLIILFMAFTIGMMAISPELIRILGGERYLDGKYVSIPMIIDAYILFLYNIIVPSEYYTKKTIYIMIGTIVASIINLLTNYIFIKKFGYVAAAYTTLFSYICYLILHMNISKRLVKFDVISIRAVLLCSFLIVALASFDLYFIDNFSLRLFIAMMIIIASFIYLNNKTDAIKRFISKFNN